jgi:glycosyltransferase involved in cell wall biosynthesis
MVTGTYYPETSGATLQCRALLRALGSRVRGHVLTTATDPSLPADDRVDGVPVARVLVDVRRAASKITAAARMTLAYLRLQGSVEIVHLHGFSQKSMLIILLARLTGKRIVVKLTSAGHDDPSSMKRRGGMQFRAFASADRYVGVSPRFAESYRQTGLPQSRFRLVPNGVDLQRFRPASPDEKRACRAALGLPQERTLILFVGFFSREKAPALLLDAWLDVVDRLPDSGLVFVGPTQSPYYEIDASIHERMIATISARGLAERVVFVERADDIEAFYRACDLFVLPSLREGLPNVVIEAMACALPVIVTRLPGVTDALVDDGVSGWLVPPADRSALAAALADAVLDPAAAADRGRAARAVVSRAYDIARVADQYAALYGELVP